MFVLHLIDAPTMHECLGILVREMAGVEHVFTIQAMITRAGARLWQGGSSHRCLHEFTTSFLERSSSLPDDASLTGLDTSIHEVIQVGVMSLDSHYASAHWSLRRLVILPG
jgi:hypothetical protein